jgi:hypothetical protein
MCGEGFVTGNNDRQGSTTIANDRQGTIAKAKVAHKPSEALLAIVADPCRSFFWGSSPIVSS